MKRATELDATELIPPIMVDRSVSLQDVFDLGKEKIEDFIEYWKKELATAKNRLCVFMDGHTSAWTSWTPDARFGASPQYAGLDRYNKQTYHTFDRYKLDDEQKNVYDGLKREVFEIETKLINLTSLREVVSKKIV